MQKTTPVTVIDFLNFTTDLFKRKHIQEARLNAELILCDILKCNRVSIYLNFEKPLSKDEVKLLKEYLMRRVKHEPLQYILGRTSFCGIEFFVNNSVLIPRPETELLVESVLKDIKDNKNNNVTIFEIGTGSGCISISLAKLLEKSKIKFDITSIDISKSALETANKNIELNKISKDHVRFYEKDIFEIEKLNKNFDYIVSNPPYISNSEYNLLESGIKDFEPDKALTDFEDGLKFYKKIFQIAADPGFRGKVFCEIGYDQKEKLESVLRKGNFKEYIFYKDYSDNDRILEIIK